LFELLTGDEKMPEPRFTYNESGRDLEISSTPPNESEETREEFLARLKKKEIREAEEDDTFWYHD